MQTKSNFLMGLFMLSFFLLAWVIHYYTPMHSDDYSYFLQGLSWESTIQHYQNWSGRLVADFVSRAILMTQNHFVIATINTAGHMLLIYLIVKIAYGKHPVSLLLFALIFILYWVSNPNLGQTTFWVVGSANYMWTNLVICLFLYFFMNHVLNQNIHFGFSFFALLILAVLAGITNENTSLTLFLVTFYYAAFYSDKAKAKIPMLLSLLVLAGALILLFAPGNFQRLEYYPHWTHLGLLEKIQLELLIRLPKIFAHFWIIFLLYIPVLVFSSKRSIHTFVFFVAAILASLAFTFSPSLMPRAMNGTLVFLLISFAYAGRTLLEEGIIFQRAMLVATIAVGACYFVPSYYYLFNAYSSMTLQAIVRDRLINNAVQTNQPEVWIPKFHSGFLVKKGDMIDTFFSDAMKKYWNYQGKITEYALNVDYSVILQEKNILHSDKDWVISCKDNYLIYEINAKPAVSALSNKENKFYLHIYYKDEATFINKDFNILLVEYNGALWAVKAVDLQNVEKVSTGLFNTESDERLFAFNFPVHGCDD